MLAVQAASQLPQVILPGYTTGTNTQATRLIVAVRQIVTIWETLLGLMFKRLIAQIRNGILYHFALAATSEQVTLMLMRNLFRSLVIFNLFC